MKYPAGEYDWLDEMLCEVLHTAITGPDFEKWKKEHPELVERLISMNSVTKDQCADREA